MYKKNFVQEIEDLPSQFDLNITSPIGTRAFLNIFNTKTHQHLNGGGQIGARLQNVLNYRITCFMLYAVTFCELELYREVIIFGNEKNRKL